MTPGFDPLTGAPLDGASPRKRRSASIDVQKAYDEACDLADRKSSQIKERRLELIKSRFDDFPIGMEIPCNGEKVVFAWKALVEKVDVERGCEAEGLLTLYSLFTSFDNEFLNDPSRMAELLPEYFDIACKLATFQREYIRLCNAFDSTLMAVMHNDKKGMKEHKALGKARDELVASKAYKKAQETHDQIVKELSRCLGKSFAVPNFLVWERYEEPIEREPKPAPELSPEEKEAFDKETSAILEAMLAAKNEFADLNAEMVAKQDGDRLDAKNIPQPEKSIEEQLEELKDFFEMDP